MENEPLIPRRIADLSEDDRPRERLLRHGPQALSDSELLAILIATGTTKCSAIQLARNLLARAGNDLNDLGRFGLDDFKKESGIGDAKAITLLAALELGRRRASAPKRDKVLVQSPADIVLLMEAELRDKNHEEMWILYLNRAHALLRRTLHSRGGATHSVVDTRLIAREALDLHADAVAMCHNHPSGHAKPSRADIDITIQVSQALGLFNIRLLDHVVVGHGQYTSIRGEGHLDGL